MKTAITITGIILIIVVCILTINFMLSTSITKVYVTNIQGEVMIETDTKTQTITEEKIISKSNSIKTQENSKATVVIHESLILNLEPGTNIVIKNIDKAQLEIDITQGEVWAINLGINDVQSIKYITENYEITTFDGQLKITPEKVEVFDGIIELLAYDQWYEGNRWDILILQNTTVESQERDETQTNQMIISAEEMLEQIINIRIREIQKITKHRFLLKSIYRTDIAELNDYINKLDNDHTLTQKAPLQTDAMQRSILLTKKISEQKSLIKSSKMATFEQ